MRNQAQNAPSPPPAQSRFMRQSNSSSKSRFTLRPRFPVPLCLQPCLDSMLTLLRVRRTKRTRFAVALSALIFLVIFVIASAIRLAHPSLTRFIPGLRTPVRAAVDPNGDIQPDVDPEVDLTDSVQDAALSTNHSIESREASETSKDTDQGVNPDSIAEPAANDASETTHGDDLGANPSGENNSIENFARAELDGNTTKSATINSDDSSGTNNEAASDSVSANPPAIKTSAQANSVESLVSDDQPAGAPQPDKSDENTPPEPPVAESEPQSEDAASENGNVAGSEVDGKSSPTLGTNLREQHVSGNVSIVVLFHKEYDSLNTALRSWIKNRLIDYVDEVMFFLNGVDSEREFKNRLPVYESEIPEGKRRIVLSQENLALGLAITRMVELAESEYVLLLEKDWELIEPEEIMKSRLDDSKVLLSTGVANVVRHRHRYNPGVPLHALIMHQGREESIIRIQKNLLCYTHHWQADPTVSFPGQGIMRRCGGVKYGLVEDNVFCTPSAFCQWTNNPGLFKKEWFMNEVGHEYRKQYQIEKDKHGLTSPFLDFEYYTNWRSYAWTDKNFTVAVGTGLFRHAESEHQHFNTFWYAHFRLTVDMEEIRKFYLQNETHFKELGGVHFDPKYPKPLTMFERYPVDFVRKFQWRDMFTGTLEAQRNMINTVYQKYVNRYRMDPEDWGSGAVVPTHAKKPVDWRTEITRLHNVVEKAMMLAPPEQPHEMSITLVTVLLDLNRHALKDDAFQFRRDFKMYMDAMDKWLTHKYKKVVYTSREIAEELIKNATDEVKESTKFVYTTKEELRTRWIGPDNYDAIQKIRTSTEWRNLASWLPNSPQGGLEFYNPLVMSKMFMMRDAARKNLWNTTHFLFLDSKHNCMSPELMTPKNDHIFRAHMFNKFLMTTFDYTPADEVHGFEYSKFNEFCNMKDPKSRQLVRVGRGGIFGGSAFVLEYITAMYDVALTGSLREGLMGTEESVFSMLLYNVRQYIDEFSNNWACPDKLDGDHACKDLKSQGYNCAIIDWAKRMAVEW